MSLQFLIDSPSLPAWNGPRRVHVLDDTTPTHDPAKKPPKPAARRWRPWMLIAPGLPVPTPAQVAACWKVLQC